MRMWLRNIPGSKQANRHKYSAFTYGGRADMNKYYYETPDLDIIYFVQEDIITTSSGTDVDDSSENVDKWP